MYRMIKFTSYFLNGYLFKFVEKKLNIGLQDVRNVWLVEPEPVQLTVAVHRGNLVYRVPVSC